MHKAPKLPQMISGTSSTKINTKEKTNTNVNANTKQRQMQIYTKNINKVSKWLQMISSSTLHKKKDKD